MAWQDRPGQAVLRTLHQTTGTVHSVALPPPCFCALSTSTQTLQRSLRGFWACAFAFFVAMTSFGMSILFCIFQWHEKAHWFPICTHAPPPYKIVLRAEWDFTQVEYESSSTALFSLWPPSGFRSFRHPSPTGPFQTGSLPLLASVARIRLMWHCPAGIALFKEGFRKKDWMIMDYN